jgi:EVE domain
MPRNFWMIVCNEENFHITKNLGFTIQGLKAQYRRKVQRVEAGDRLLYYVSGIRRFTATAMVTSSYQEDDAPIWKDEGSTGWPYRVSIKPEVVLDESQYIDAGLLAHRLDYVRRWPPENWYMAFQGNLHLLPKNDFSLIEEEMKKLKYGRDYNQQSEPAQPKVRPRSRKQRGNGSQGTGSTNSTEGDGARSLEEHN